MATANITATTEPNNTRFTADMVRTYLREIGRVPLLTHEQEIVYGKQVQQMMKLIEEEEEGSRQGQGRCCAPDTGNAVRRPVGEDRQGRLVPPQEQEPGHR